MKYLFQARTEKGELRSGIVEASSREVAISLLQKMGLYVTYLELERVPFYAQKISYFRRITKKDIVFFTRQLAIMCGGKIPLVEALGTLANQTPNPALREIAFNITKDVEGGNTLSEALSKYPKVFSIFFVAMVKAGETVGKLGETLNYLADHIEREYNLQSRIKGSMIYPVLVLVVAFAIVFLLTFFVIPRIEEIILTTGAQLPLVTKIVIGFSKFLIKYFTIILLVFLFLGFLIYRYYKTKEGRHFFDSFFLKLPILGQISKNLYIAQFSENLSTLITGGISITRALELTGDIINNIIYKEAIYSIMEGVKRGALISEALYQFSQIFPLVTVQMVAAGEKTGTLDTTLKNLALFYQKEAEKRIEDALTLLEPLMIIFLGVIVGGLVLSVLLPIYQTLKIGF